MEGQDNMRPAASTKLTYEDFLLFPEDGLRHELIDGEHYVTASPVTQHQRILRRLSYAIEHWLTDHPVGEMFFACIDVKLSEFDVVVPDLIYIAAEHADRIQAKGLFDAPDLVVEILSPSTRRRDERLKRDLYERVKCAEYWMIDPDRRTVTVYCRADGRFAPPATLSATSGDALTSSLFPGLAIPLDRLLAP